MLIIALYVLAILFLAFIQLKKLSNHSACAIVKATMALSPENTHLLEQLADNVPEGRRMIISAWTMLSRRTGERPDTPDSAQRIFEASARIPSLTRGVDGEPVIRIVEFYERMALNLSRTALRISVAHNDTPIEVVSLPGRDLYHYPRTVWTVGLRPDFVPGESAYFSRVIASDAIGHDVRPELPFTAQEFESVFYHAAAQHGLYRFVKSDQAHHAESA